MTVEHRCVAGSEHDAADHVPATTPPCCCLCHRERTVADVAHPMDSYDYNPLQAITGQPLGWYSGDDGEICPECMTSTMRGQQ